MFHVEFYETADGQQPVADFLDSLDDKMAAKLIGLMEILEEKGTELRMPYSEALDDGIFELRCKFGNQISRALYFFFVGKRIIITNGFIKKTQKTPQNELKKALKYKKDYERKHSHE